MTALTEAARVLEQSGLVVDELKADGLLHRCGTIEKPRKNDAAYVVHIDDPVTVWWMNWRTGETGTWSAKENNDRLTTEERKYIDDRRRQRKIKQDKDYTEAAFRAQAIIARATPADISNPYLMCKGVEPCSGLMSLGKVLVVPVLGGNGKAQSLQYIQPDGQKRFLPKARTVDGYFPIMSQAQNGPLFIVEGIATGLSVHKATDGAVLCTFNCGNLKSVAEIVRAKYPGREIIICADNDVEIKGNPGVSKAREAAQAIDGKVIVPTMPDGGRGDFNDLHQAAGIENVRRQIEIGQKAKPERQLLRLIPFDEMVTASKPINWGIRGIIEEGSLVTLYGEPGSTKSFVGIDIGMCWATGTSWHGHEVPTPGPVVYVAGEGQRGIPRRLKAWALAHGIETGVPFYTSTRAAQFLNAASVTELHHVMQEIVETQGTPRLLIIDTLARNFGPGDENSTGDMTRFISVMDEIKAAFGCTVLIIHHTGLADKTRARGSSALYGGVEVEFRLEKSKDGSRILHFTKMKDGEEPQPMVFNPRVVPLGWYDPETGEEYTSIVLEQTDAPAMLKKKFTRATRIAFESLKSLINKHRKADKTIDPKEAQISLTEWREEAYKNGISNSSKDSARRMAFQRATNMLFDEGLVSASNGYYWPDE